MKHKWCFYNLKQRLLSGPFDICGGSLEYGGVWLYGSRSGASGGAVKID